MTQRFLAARPDIFPDYTLDGFRAALAAQFPIHEDAPIADSKRTLFLMERRGGSPSGDSRPSLSTPGGARDRYLPVPRPGSTPSAYG